jgi:hypothetical protein
VFPAALDQVAIVNVRANAYNWLQPRKDESTMDSRSPYPYSNQLKNGLTMNPSSINRNETYGASSLPIASMSGSVPDETMIHGSKTSGLGACCSIGDCSIRRALWAMTAAIVLFGTLAIGFMVWFTQQTRTSQATNWSIPSVIDATAAVSSEKYSIATGLVGDSEGFFVLDHNSGMLQCTVMYSRMGKFNARFMVNVNDALGAGSKGGQYVMVTGQADFPASSNNPVASTVVYVLNTATGNFAAYGVPFDRTALNAGRPQQGAMFLLGTGQANPVVDRDAVR